MSTFRTSRDIAATPDQIFAAFTDTKRLASWWGPAGFSNTFDTCNFTPGGTWSYVMHGPDGKHFKNESVFEEIDLGHKLVIRHVSKPEYTLTITLTSSASEPGSTNVSWVQEFDDSEIARRIEHIVVPANDQNLDRLSAEVLSPSSNS